MIDGTARPGPMAAHDKAADPLPADRGCDSEDVRGRGVAGAPERAGRGALRGRVLRRGGKEIWGYLLLVVY